MSSEGRGGATRNEQKPGAKVIPIYGRDEMNLCDIPYGPLTRGKSNTFQVNHTVFDRKRNRTVEKVLTITGSAAFGLPKPIDDQVLLGLKAITYNSGFQSRKVWFSRYQLCQILGWRPDGRAYRRIEESLDRITGTTLKFKDGWWDKEELRWRSRTFHLLESVELCSHDSYETVVAKTGRKAQALCNIVWNEIIWKSFQDGYIRQLDLELVRRVACGPRRFAAVRLLRILDKHFYRKRVQRWDVRRLCVGTLGLTSKYTSKMIPVLERAATILVAHDYLESYKIRTGKTGEPEVVFVKAGAKASSRESRASKALAATPSKVPGELSARWFAAYSLSELDAAEEHALELEFGSRFERENVKKERQKGASILEGSLVRRNFVKRYLEEGEDQRRSTAAG